MDGVAVRPLTVSFHEGEFLEKVNEENTLGFWFQLDEAQQEELGSTWGPANPQALNRYSYVQNNPLNWDDPTGHQGRRIPGVCACGGGRPGGGRGNRGGGGSGSNSSSVVGAGASSKAGQGIVDGVTLLVGGVGGVAASQSARSDEPAETTILESRRYAGDRRTARQIINDEKQGGINGEFPGEWKDATPDEIYAAAERGNPKARTAKKLLDDKRFDKKRK